MPESRIIEIEPVMVTISQAARLLGVSTSTLWRLRQSHGLRPIQIGRLRRYRLADIRRFVEELPDAET